MTIRQLLIKHGIQHGIENDQARLNAFIGDLEKELLGPLHFDPVPLEWYTPIRHIATFLGTTVEKMLERRGK